MKLSESMAEKQATAGLPKAPLLDRHVVTDSRGKWILLACRIRGEHGTLSHAFLRPINEPHYISIGSRFAVLLADNAEIAVDTPLFSGDSFLYCHLSCPVGRRASDGSRQVTAVEPLGLGRIHLSTQAADVWMPSGWFVSELLGCREGTEIFAVVGSPAPGRVGPVKYEVSRLDWESKSKTLLAPFENVFF